MPLARSARERDRLLRQSACGIGLLIDATAIAMALGRDVLPPEARPFAVALILVNGLSATAVLLPAGLLYIAAGLYYRVPVPVQPLKAFGAIAVAQGFGPDVVAAVAAGVCAMAACAKPTRSAAGNSRCRMERIREEVCAPYATPERGVSAFFGGRGTAMRGVECGAGRARTHERPTERRGVRDH